LNKLSISRSKKLSRLIPDRRRINCETGESATPDLSTEDGAKASILFLQSHKKSACIFFHKRWVEGASKVREDKTLANKAVKLRIVIEE
jgi:hypothetical protein